MYSRTKRNRGNSCCCNCRNCREMSEMPEYPVLANSYVPYQSFNEIFEPAEALANGTAFPELVRPYVQNQSQCIINYLEGTQTCEEVDECGK